MNLIMCVDNNFGIGKNNSLLFNIPTDLKYFSNLTKNKVVVMGYNTLLSLPNSQPLKNRINIVLTRKNLTIDNIVVCNSLQDLFNKLKNYNGDEIFVIGGEQIYKLLLPYCKLAYVTKVFQTTDADKYAPNFDKLSNWELISSSEKQNENNLIFSFLVYKNKSVLEYK